MKKDYAPIPILATDKRKFVVKFFTGFNTIETHFTQLEFLQLMTYLKGKNDRLYHEFYKFIHACDIELKEKTDFDRKISRRRIYERLS